MFAHSRCFHLRTRSTIMILYAKTDRLSNMQRLNQILRLTRRTVLRQKAQLYKLRCVCRTDRDAQAAHDKADNPLYQFLYNWYLFHCQRYACAYKHNHSCINKVGYVILHKANDLIPSLFNRCRKISCRTYMPNVLQDMVNRIVSGWPKVYYPAFFPPGYRICSAGV